MSVERILLLSTSYPRTSHDPSGHFVESHARALRNEGASVHVLAPGPLSEERGSSSGLSVERLGAEHLFGWPGASERARENPLRLFEVAPFAVRMRRRTAQLGAFDRIVAHWMVPTAFPFLAYAERDLALARADLDVIAHGADVRLLRALPAGVRSRVAGWLTRRTRRFTFVAQSLREAFLETLPASIADEIFEKSEVRPCPISIPTREALPDPRPDDEASEPYAVWVGRDIGPKRLDLAIAAARTAGVRLVVVGANDRGLRYRGIHFVGARPRFEALAWIAHASVLLSTSNEEAAPTATREARALGVRVVACAAGDLSAWSLRDDGISMVDSDVHAIARALQAGVAL